MAVVVERLRSPAAKVVRGAGPPERLVIAMFVLGGIVDLGLALATRGALPLMALALPPTALTLAASILDRDGWTIRSAIASVGLEQRRRRSGPRLPVTPSAARRWLAAEHPDAPDLERVSVLVTAGRYEAAMDALAAVTPVDPVDEVRVMRLRQVVAAAIDQSREIDVPAIASAARDLAPDEGRYNVLSAAWSRAWLDVVGRRPWRSRFAAVARELGPYELPGWVRLVIAAQQCAAPIACVLAFLILTPVVGLLGW